MKRPSVSLMLTAVLIAIKVALLFQEKGSLPVATYFEILAVAYAFYLATSILVKALRGEEYIPAMTWRKWDFKNVSRKEAPIRFYLNLIFIAILDVVFVIMMLQLSKV